MNFPRMMIFLLTLGMSLFAFSNVWGGSVTIPNSFSSGAATSASQMNANFTAVKTAVDDNNTRIAALEAGTRPVFQGFSAATQNGGVGLIAMQQACSASFPGSKCCTTTEMANSTYNSNASNLSGNAWILPDLIAMTNTNTSNSSTYSVVADKSSGLAPAVPGYFNCSGWSTDSGSGYGTTVSSAGKFTTTLCNSVQAVACCK